MARISFCAKCKGKGWYIRMPSVKVFMSAFDGLPNALSRSIIHCDCIDKLKKLREEKKREKTSPSS